MNKYKSKTYNQLRYYNNYKHVTFAGIFIVFGLLMLLGIPTFPKNLLLSLLCFLIAYFGYRTLKTTKPISISKYELCLGKMVNGFKDTIIKANSIFSIDLVHEIKTVSRKSGKDMGILADVDIHSNYYEIKLKDSSSVCFADLYDEQLQNALKQWCLDNEIELKLNVKRIIKENDDDLG